MKTFRQFVLYVTVLTGAIVLLGCSSVVEVTVMRGGSGYGTVTGTSISCGRSCQQSYPKGTLLTLEAVPDSDSTFTGWFVNGKPHASGQISLNTSIVITALFDMTYASEYAVLWWYGEEMVESVVIAPDMLRIYLDPIGHDFTETAEEQQRLFRTLATYFHPQAEVISETSGQFLLKSPVPLTKEQWFERRTMIDAFPAVQYSSPICLAHPESRDEELILTDRLVVQYVHTASERDIASLERKFQLTRFQVGYREGTRVYVYHTGDPLMVIEVSQQLSVLPHVKAAYPGVTQLDHIAY